MQGFRHYPQALDRPAQEALVLKVLEAEKSAPFFRPLTPGGKPFSVRMTNLGPLGWVSDRSGYRYQATHPQTGRPWPPIPKAVLEVWEAFAEVSAPPDACLVNLYRDGARMGLHQDRDEEDFSFPVVSISLGDPAVFRIGPAKGGKTLSVRLNSGDVCVFGGPARLARHGVDRVLEGGSTLIPGGGRLNLTLRRARSA
ncbi:MAG TPA: alpha-ketoglutarate-dependent dioxygenase AlkB [Caulobacteraceae bacterium]|jgi:alkylated DNA repair protein (DNA oxidative demethylase)|nr:alpha-ketoglutarate-dependent dioxygenase AlkB [Caulobacteraceae bacterium]